MTRRSSQFGRLLAAGLLFASSVSALPTELHVEQREVAYVAPKPWVTVDAAGSATTITPSITTINGAATTISPPPDALTKTGTYTLQPTSAQVTTSTGLSPVATASSSNGEGAFLACTQGIGIDAPFCQPKAGSHLNPGKTYYITWSPSYFANSNTSVEIQGTYHDSSQEGFTSPRMEASQGYYVWNIADTFLTSHDPILTTMNVSLTLAYFQDTYGNDVEGIPGPTVVVTSTPADDDPKDAAGADGPNVVAIAVPVVIVVVFLALAGLCVWSWRRNGTVPGLGALRRRSAGGGGGGGQGYGIGQSRSQRVGGAAGAPDPVAGAGAGSDKEGAGGIQLTDRESWSPGNSPGGTNVFREEMRRQERER